MAIQGLRTTSNFVTDQRPKNWREGVMLLYPNGKMPLFALTSMMKKRSVDDAEFNWWTKNMQTRRFQLHATTGDLTTVNTAFALVATAKAKGLKEGDQLYVEQTGEIITISSDPTSDTAFTAARGSLGSTAATVDPNGNGINPFMVVIGNAHEEGSLAPTGISFDPTKRYNYTQIFRDTLEATRTAIKTRLRTGDAIKEAKRECLEIHSQGIERAMFLGNRYETTKNGKPIRNMGGILNQIDSANIKNALTDYAGGVTMLGLEEYLYDIFKEGSNEKLAFMGNRALLTIQQIIRKNSSMQIESGLKEYGMNVSRLTTPYGELVMKTHPMFNQLTGGTTGSADYFGMESWMVALDMAEISYVHLDDGDTKYQPKLQSNDLDGEKSGYLTECSVQINHPSVHHVIKSLHSGVADA